MNKPTTKSVISSTTIMVMLFQSCYIMPAKSYNQNVQNKSFKVAVDKLHQRSMEATNLDSLYCNLDLFMETLASFRTDFRELKFSSRGIEKVKTELMIVYDKYRNGDRLIFKSEFELREKIGEYLKWVIDDAKAGNNEYEVKNVKELKESGILDGKRNELRKRKPN